MDPAPKAGVNRTRVGLGIASVLAGTAVLFVVLGATYNLFLLVVAIPTGFAAYLIWADVTGRYTVRARTRVGDRARERTRRSRGRQRYDRNRNRSGSRSATPTNQGLTKERARRVLGVDSDAGERELTRAYRDLVKEVHPDADGGDEAAFKRVNKAYERLTE